MTILDRIQQLAKDRDHDVEFAYARLCGAIQRLRKQNPYQLSLPLYKPRHKEST